MAMRSFVPLFAGALALAAACGGKTTDTGGSGDGGSCGVGAGTDCVVDDTLLCTGGAIGFTCAVGDDPQSEDPSYSCSSPQVSGCMASYCCDTAQLGCAADDAVTCSDPDAYGYQCATGDDPTELDSRLECSAPTPDADGVHDDYCCIYLGSSSSSGGSDGGAPAGCTLDTTLGCAGGADGYACDTGDNPEAEDPSLSCSTPQASDGEDDYCCFSGGDWSDTTCEPDDDLTALCPDPGEYGYQCASGDDPSTLDSSLVSCSTPTPDADGVHDDYCCTY